MTARRARTWIAALASAVGLSHGCTSSPPNVVLVVVDTLRADHVNGAGRARALSPQVDALQGQGTWFPNAYSTSSWTLPSVASLLVSQYPSRHGVVHWGAQLSPERVTMVELLHEAGYRTGAWTANIMLTRQAGFDQGFDVYKVRMGPNWEDAPMGMVPNGPARALIDGALRWLREGREQGATAPFFVYLHLMEPHTPYRCPESAGKRCEMVAELLNRRLASLDWDFNPRERRTLRRLYDAEVHSMDAALGDLVTALQEQGFWENTWLILTADHGESLGERGRYLHGKTLYQHLVRIPLLISGPSRRASQVDAPVSLVDVAPTILELAGIEVPQDFVGRSLAGALRGEPLPPVPVASELFPTVGEAPHHRLAVIDGDQKLLLGSGGEIQRFDLKRDPGERRPIPASARQLSDAVAGLGDAVDLDADTSGDTPDLSPEMRERLRALGYGE